MIIDLKQLFKEQGRVESVDYSFSMADEEIDGFKPFVSPITVKGELKNYAGSVELLVEISYDFSMPCSRCLEETLTKNNLKVHHALVREELDDSSDFYLTVEVVVDLDEIIYQEIILNLPVRYICKDDCRGICPTCGANLNITNCSCEVVKTESSFSGLKALLDV